VAVLGAGGIGKTTLAAQLAQDLVPRFRRVYWRSLRDAPPSHDWLAGAIGFLSDQQAAPPEGDAARLDLVLQLLRERPGLLVLDNFEALLQPGDPEGRYRDGYGGYGRLLHAIGAGRHRSCLVLTSREAPPELADLAGGPVRTLELGGLDVAAGQLLLAHKHLSGDTQEWAELIMRFDGNGLALKVVGESIREVFGGDLGAFLEEAGAGTGFAGIRRLLAALRLVNVGQAGHFGDGWTWCGRFMLVPAHGHSENHRARDGHGTLGRPLSCVFWLVSCQPVRGLEVSAGC